MIKQTSFGDQEAWFEFSYMILMKKYEMNIKRLCSAGSSRNAMWAHVLAVPLSGHLQLLL